MPDLQSSARIDLPVAQRSAVHEKAEEPPVPASRQTEDLDRQTSRLEAGQSLTETFGQSLTETLKGHVGGVAPETLGNVVSSKSGTTRVPLPEGRAVEAVNMLEELYHYMTSSAVAGGDVCPAVRVPLTLVFRLTRPHTWYECRREVGGGMRGTDVTETSDEIIERFRLGAHEGSCGILAVYMYNKPAPGASRRDGPQPARQRTCVEYFDEPLLEDFLRNRRREHDGVLQQFCAPTGGRASCLRARARGSVRAAAGELRVRLESR